MRLFLVISFPMVIYYFFLNYYDFEGDSINTHNIVVGLGWLYVFIGSLFAVVKKKKE